MSLNDETKKLANDLFAAIENEKRKAYHEGYTKGIMDWQKTSKMLDEWREAVRLKDAPSAMDSIPVAPVPCVNGMAGKTVKDFLQKFDEEVDEWKQEVFSVASLDDEMSDVKELLTGYDADELDTEKMRRIAEEAADICTVLASFMEAAGIGFTIRNEAQAHVNRHNHERGRN